MRLPVIGGGDFDVLATLTLPYTKANERRFASIHSNPPGIPTDIPGLVTRKLGAGRVIWCAAAFEGDERRAHKNLLTAIIHAYAPRPFTLQSTAPRQVELVSFRGEGELLISAVDLLCTEELLPVPTFKIGALCPPAARVFRITDAGGEEEIPSTHRDGRGEFGVESLVMFAMYRIVWRGREGDTTVTGCEEKLE